MFKNYLKIAWRNLLKSKAYSAINILGLSVGMTVVVLIGLWIHDELTYNKCHDKYDLLGQVLITQTFNGEIGTGSAIAIPLADELRTKYGGDFDQVSLSSWNMERIVAYGDKKFTKEGMWVQPNFPDMLGLKMLAGSRSALKDPSVMILSASLAKSLFGKEDPMNKTIKINNKTVFTVGGVYEDMPHNTTLQDATFFGPWDNYFNSEPWIKNAVQNWGNHSWQLFVQMNKHADVSKVNAKIKDVPMQHLKASEGWDEHVLIHRMCDWHLYSKFKNGKIVGGRIQFVWLFGTIGFFVLLLACINFMNLGTARSEKRAKEVGIRKTIGSVRRQLIAQFLSESVLLALLSFIVAIILVQLSLPWFNKLADKDMSILWANPLFWLCCIAFTILTGLLAGSYPAFYLSSFQPIKVIKGTFKASRFSSVPRKILVVVQFTVSVMLIIGTIVVFRQIQYAKNRPVGYTREGLFQVSINTPDIYGHYDILRSDLLKTGVVANMSESSSPVTAVWSNQIGFDWEGKDPNATPLLGTIAVTHDFGKTIGWKIIRGRDFSREFGTDSLALLLNESAVKLTGIKEPVGKVIKWNGKAYTVIGIVKDMVMQSPYEPVQPTLFTLNYDWTSIITVKINPETSMSRALAMVEPVFKKYNPGSPFDYKFIDQEYARKFESEERIGKLASFFAVLAIFISCLGIFGLASFVAEQRTKEIGVRKVLGATIFNIWQLLSKDFLLLVTIAFIIATPLAYLFMHNWLKDYEYRTILSWWIFAVSCAGALLITIATVSYQAIRAALNNPVKSLRSE